MSQSVKDRLDQEHDVVGSHRRLMYCTDDVPKRSGKTKTDDDNRNDNEAANGPTGQTRRIKKCFELFFSFFLFSFASGQWKPSFYNEQWMLMASREGMRARREIGEYWDMEQELKEGKCINR